MASLCRRTIFQFSHRAFTTSVIARKQDKLPNPLEFATGLEKQELLARQAGHDDPFMMKAVKRGVGTKVEPTLVPSAFESRIIGCVCEEDSTSIVWMWLHEGEPRRCECGHWFKLHKKQPVVNIDG